MPEGMGKAWYTLQASASCLIACIVVWIAHSQNNMCKQIATIAALEIILATLYACALTEYTLAEIALNAGRLPAETALFDDNIVLIEQTFSIIIGLILTTGAPWGGILNGFMDFAKRPLSKLAALGLRFVHTYPNLHRCKVAHQNLKIALQGQKR